MNRIEAFEALKRGDYVYNINNPNCIYHINTINQPGGKIIIQYLNSDNFILKCIANLIYFFDPRECDSKIHELYLDLKVAHGSFNECAQIKERDLCLKECFFPLLEMKKEIVSNILENIFQISYEKFFEYIKSQIHYFNKKAIRVYNKFAQDGKINEVKIMRRNKGFLIR